MSNLKTEDALLFLVEYLRKGRSAYFGPSGPADYGYDVYMLNPMRAYYRQSHRADLMQEPGAPERVAPVFLDAAWELCRRGILRPGIRTWNVQATNDGSAGFGFTITPFGRTWLNEAEHDTFVPTEPERFGQLLERYRVRCGNGFHQRAQEAIRCYGAHAYLACCVMCGAASESIVLALATQKLGESEAVATYTSANGRSRLESRLIGQVNDRLKNDFQALSILLKYWRDDSAHGQETVIADNEAYTSIAMLLRFAAFIDDNWTAFTRSGG
jgi:hypothetical protein